jgi:hypothetical protein
MTMRGLDHWLTTEPDDGYRREPCDYCNGRGFVAFVTYWRGYPQEGGEAECPECEGEGRIVFDPSGLPVRELAKRVARDCKTIRDTLKFGEVK